MLKLLNNPQTFPMFSAAFTRITQLTNVVLLVCLVQTVFLGVVCLCSVGILGLFSTSMLHSLPGTVVPPSFSPPSLDAFRRS